MFLGGGGLGRSTAGGGGGLARTAGGGGDAVGGGLDTGEGGGGGGDATGKVATAAFTALNAFSLLPMVHGAQNDGPHLGGAGEGGVDRAHQCGDSRHVRAGH